MTSFVGNNRSTIPRNPATKKDLQPSKLITFQATFIKNDKEKVNMTQASQAIIFEKLPLIRVLFDSKLNGTLKDDNDQICYDPEHARTERLAFPRIPGKTVYMYNLIQSNLKNKGREYEHIAKWNIGTLWTIIDCLVRFLNGKPLPPDSKMGLMEKHWDLELIGVEILAIYLGCTEIKEKAVHDALISYMRRLPTSGFINSSSKLEKTSKTTTHAKMFNRSNSRQAEIIDLTEENQIGAPKTLKEKQSSAPKSQKSNLGQLSSGPKILEMEPPPVSTSKNSVRAGQSKFDSRNSKTGDPAPTLHRSKSSMQSNQISQGQKKATRPSPTQQKSNKESHQIITTQPSIEITR
ncbi:hypothetical protein BPOR_0913g00010 [Botrytis porri]|nr:hypothetical protein BPOR_0913g00010 [Botrytis porri]